jgi:hypothetical protein
MAVDLPAERADEALLLHGGSIGLSVLFVCRQGTR